MKIGWYVFYVLIFKSKAFEKRGCGGNNIYNFCNGLNGLSIPTLGDSKKLQNLLIFNSDLSSLEPDSFASYLHLKSLQISNSSLPTNQMNLRSVQNIEIENSFFQDFVNLFNSTSLLNLSISDSEIPEITDRAFRNAPSLQNIILTNNGIRTIQSDAFRNLPDLKTVDFRDNNIEWQAGSGNDWLLVLDGKSTRLQLKGNPICTSFRGHILKGGTSNDVQMILRDGNMWQHRQGVFRVLSSACGEEANPVDQNSQSIKVEVTTALPREQEQNNTDTDEHSQNDWRPSESIYIIIEGKIVLIFLILLGIFTSALLIWRFGFLEKILKQWKHWKMTRDGSHELGLESQKTPLATNV